MAAPTPSHRAAPSAASSPSASDHHATFSRAAVRGAAAPPSPRSPLRGDRDADRDADLSSDHEHEDDDDRDDDGDDEDTDDPDSIPVDRLVDHLLAAKRSLSSMTLVLRANDLCTAARSLHEESAVLSAQAAYLRRAVSDQCVLLLRVRRSLQRAYDFGRRDFKHLVKSMDAADGRLREVMGTLRGTRVEEVFRPAGEEPKSLLDFLDEKSVHAVVEALKKSLGELQVRQTP